MGDSDYGFDEQEPQHNGAVGTFDPTGAVATLVVGERGFYCSLSIAPIWQVCNPRGVGSTGGDAAANSIPESCVVDMANKDSSRLGCRLLWIWVVAHTVLPH